MTAQIRNLLFAQALHSNTMLNRKVKLMIGCILLILFVLGASSFLRYMSTRAQRQEFNKRFGAEVERKRGSDNVVEIRMKDLTDFT